MGLCTSCIHKKLKLYCRKSKIISCFIIWTIYISRRNRFRKSSKVEQRSIRWLFHCSTSRRWCCASSSPAATSTPSPPSSSASPAALSTRSSPSRSRPEGPSTGSPFLMAWALSQRTSFRWRSIWTGTKLIVSKAATILINCGARADQDPRRLQLLHQITKRCSNEE